MSVTVAKDKGVTVITVATSRDSMLPPLCQILKSLCYSPACCSVNRGMMRTSVTVALGVMQIMVGLFSIGLGPGRTSLHPGDFAHLGFAYWLGGVSIAVGITSLLAGWFPSQCLVVLTVMMNVVGSVVTLVGVVLYGMDIKDVSQADLCDQDRTRNFDMCNSVQYFYQRLVVGMDITMIVLTVLQLLVCICITVSAISALCGLSKKEQGDRADEVDQPLLKEVLMTSPGA